MSKQTEDPSERPHDTKSGWAFAPLVVITLVALGMAIFLHAGPARNAQAIRDATVDVICAVSGCNSSVMAVAGVLMVLVPGVCWQLFKLFWDEDTVVQGHPAWWITGYGVLCAILAVSILWMPAPGGHSGRGSGPPQVEVRPEAVPLEDGMSWGLGAFFVAMIFLLVADIRDAEQRTRHLLGLAPFIPAAIVAAVLA
ncbi:hypothetical protein [Actinoplanes sp. M2I2]|uniref:hypothetical protein n=1 Tax=Actinoplanes sp. M2I2 TaxID=1734444 RepID=UPI002020673B|nr:hypothetical protein [Actinoplanes sp. M2I2]